MRGEGPSENVVCGGNEKRADIHTPVLKWVSSGGSNVWFLKDKCLEWVNVYVTCL